MNEKTIYRLAQRGKLPSFKVAVAWGFQRQDIQVWIDEQKLALTKTTAKSKGSTS